MNGMIGPIWLIVASVFAVFGSWVSGQCGRRQGEGFLLGLLFGPVGVIVSALLPRRII